MFYIWNDIITLGYGFIYEILKIIFFLQGSLKNLNFFEKKITNFKTVTCLLKNEQQFFQTKKCTVDYLSTCTYHHVWAPHHWQSQFIYK